MLGLEYAQLSGEVKTKPATARYSRHVHAGFNTGAPLPDRLVLAVQDMESRMTNIQAHTAPGRSDVHMMNLPVNQTVVIPAALHDCVCGDRFDTYDRQLCPYNILL